MTEPQTRRLAAILAADVVGYSRLMGADEDGTVTALRGLRAELFDPTIEKHHGRIVKLMGDGMLVEFGSVVDAVNCAVEVQAALTERNADLPEDRRIEQRIGINLGDMIVDGDDLYGDGVNIAARLEGIADAGGIYVSAVVADQARGKVEAGFEDLGERELKNIETPVRVYRVVPAGVVVSAGRRAKSGRPVVLAAVGVALVACVGAIGGWYLSQPSNAAAIDIDQVLTIKGPMVAITPFENHGDKAHDGFARGMTEQVAAALTRFSGIRVMSPRIAASKAGSIAELRALGTRYVVEGSVDRVNDKMRVGVALSNAVSGDQIWAETFKEDLTPESVLDVQEKVSARIAASIASGDGSPISLDRLKDANGKPPESMGALDCVHSNSSWSSPEEAHRLYRCLLKTVEADPGYAEGWYLLSGIYLLDYFWDYQFRTDGEYDPRALTLTAASRAVEIAPSSARAHYELARAYIVNGQYDRFEQEAQRAIELNPNDASMIATLGMYISFTGRYDEGNRLIRKALDFNPSVVPPYVFYALAKEHYVNGEYDEAITEFRKTFIPGFWLNDVVSAYTYSAWGKPKEAEAAAAELLKKRADFVIDDAVALYRKFLFPQSYIEQMTVDLRRAGLRSRGGS